MTQAKVPNDQLEEKKRKEGQLVYLKHTVRKCILKILSMNSHVEIRPLAIIKEKFGIFA